jgi:hypothetical protein
MFERINKKNNTIGYGDTSFVKEIKSKIKKRVNITHTDDENFKTPGRGNSSYTKIQNKCIIF